MSRGPAKSTTPSNAAGIPRPPRRSSETISLRLIEKIVVLHLAGLVLLATWFFGGGSDLARLLISIWGSLAFAVLLWAIVAQRRVSSPPSSPVSWLWPLIAFNALVVASCCNPSFAEKTLAGESLLAHTGAAHPILPSTAHVATSLRHLWLFDALYCSAFNLTLIRRRRTVRRLLLFACANAVVLSIFGTLQKLTADGLFFGAVHSPNARFFATFVYANHWAAWVVLQIAVAGGLLFRHLRRHDDGPEAHAQTGIGVIAILLMAITPVIAGSRAGSIMAVALMLAFGWRVLTQASQERFAPPFLRTLRVAILVVGALLGTGVAAWLGKEALQERWSDTKHQWQGEFFQGRRELYRDTFTLVRQQPVFGWGLGNYGKVFQLVRPRSLEANRQYERSYVDAHSDVLQALAEVGVVGTALLFLSAALPLRAFRGIHLQSGVVRFSLLGCLMVALYAFVEFPFGNPAVVATWWTIFFSAVQTARLQVPLPSHGNETARIVT